MRLLGHLFDLRPQHQEGLSPSSLLMAPLSGCGFSSVKGEVFSSSTPPESASRTTVFSLPLPALSLPPSLQSLPLLPVSYSEAQTKPRQA